MFEKMNYNQWIILFEGLLIFILLSVDVIQQRKIEKLQLEPPSTAYDRPLVVNAARLWAIKNHVSYQRIMKERYAKVMYIGNEVCVSIENDLGGVGGVPVYCFDVGSQKLTRRLDNVE